MYGGKDFEKEENFFPLRIGGERALSVFVQNDGSSHFPDVTDGINLSGSNRLREFSGWQEGIEFLLKEGMIVDEDILILTNDSIFREKRLLPIIRKGCDRLVGLNISENQILGPVEYHLFDIKVFDVRLTRLVATYFLAINWKSLKIIGGICGDVDFDACLSLSFEDGDLFRMPNSTSYNKFYNQWLGSGCKNGRGNWWASERKPFEAKNYGFLRDKAKMILLESHLTKQLIEHRFEIIDLYETSQLSVFKKRIKRVLFLINSSMKTTKR
jgi:hypothetical protein